MATLAIRRSRRIARCKKLASPFWVEAPSRLRCLDQQESQQRTALLADVTQSSMNATRSFFRNQPDITADLLSTSKPFRVSNNEHKGESRDRPDSGMGHQKPNLRSLLRFLLNRCTEFFYASVQLI